VFFGTFQHAIDAKGRTSLPAKFREALASAGEPRIVQTVRGVGYVVREP